MQSLTLTLTRTPPSAKLLFAADFLELPPRGAVAHQASRSVLGPHGSVLQLARERAGMTSNGIMILTGETTAPVTTHPPAAIAAAAAALGNTPWLMQAGDKLKTFVYV